MKSKICVFDFDGTLTTCDTLLRFIPFACGRWAFWWGMLLHAPLLVLMKLGLYDNGRAKERVFRYFFRGMKESMFNNLCDSFADANDDILRPEGIKTLRQALADGHPVFVVSASIDRWVRPFFECRRCENGLEGDLAPSQTRTPVPSIIIIGTQIEVTDGRLTGRFATPNCYGEEKVRRLRQLFPELSDYHMIAYGDSSGDRELMTLANEAHYKPFRSSFQSQA